MVLSDQNFSLLEFALLFQSSRINGYYHHQSTCGFNVSNQQTSFLMYNPSSADSPESYPAMLAACRTEGGSMNPLR